MNLRRRVPDVLLALTSVLLVAATLLGYAWRVVFDSERATAERVTDELVRPHPDLLAVRPAVVSR